jgi:hypothetical protein
MTAPNSDVHSLRVGLARRLEDAYAVCVTAETALAAQNADYDAEIGPVPARCSKCGTRGAEVIAVSIRRNPWPRIPSVTRRRSFVTRSSRRCTPASLLVGIDRHHSTAQDYDRLGHR